MDESRGLSHLAQQRATDIAVIKESKGKKNMSESSGGQSADEVTDRKQTEAKVIGKKKGGQ